MLIFAVAVDLEGADGAWCQVENRKVLPRFTAVLAAGPDAANQGRRRLGALQADGGAGLDVVDPVHGDRPGFVHPQQARPLQPDVVAAVGRAGIDPESQFPGPPVSRRAD